MSAGLAVCTAVLVLEIEEEMAERFISVELSESCSLVKLVDGGCCFSSNLSDETNGLRLTRNGKCRCLVMARAGNASL